MKLQELLPYEYVDSVFDIDYRKLYSAGCRGLIFDIDNTLVHHGDDSTPEVDALFGRLAEMGFRIVFLSDNSEERVRRFLRRIDAPYVCEADKPGTAGYLRALELLGLEKEQTVCIGDQMFTDVLGANRAGIPSILVRFIRLPDERWIGKRRYVEYAALLLGQLEGKTHRLGGVGRLSGAMGTHDRLTRFFRRELLFGDISPVCYEIATEKEILRRNLQDARGKKRFAADKRTSPLPNSVYAYDSGLIKRGPGIDPVLQQNKAVNIDLAAKQLNGLVLHPGEEFSFWHTVGRTSRRKGYLDGRVIEGGELRPGLGGGLCNLGNTIHLLALHSPLTITEVHHHSDALAPDHGARVPFSSGTSVSYNYLDLRFRNDTDQDFQLLVWCADERLYAELRSEKAVAFRYGLSEENHHFRQEGERWFRVSKIYRDTYDAASGALLRKDLIRDNHSEVMFDPSLIPPEQIRQESAATK